MPYKDQKVEKAKALERSRKHRAGKHAKRYGPGAGPMNRRHGNHATGERNARYKGGRFVTSHCYVAIRVPADHPHAWGAHPRLKYAYEHILIAEAALGRSLSANEIVHHKNEIKTDNRWPENLEVLTVQAHMLEHSRRRGRDELGRFPPADLRVREFPEAAA
jgi:hypothetical protein